MGPTAWRPQEAGKQGVRLHPSGRMSKRESRGTVSSAFAVKGNGSGGSALEKNIGSRN